MNQQAATPNTKALDSEYFDEGENDEEEEVDPAEASFYADAIEDHSELPGKTFADTTNSTDIQSYLHEN